MKIIIKERPATDYRGASVTIKVDGKKVAYAFDMSEVPEDASVERDLGFIFDIPQLMEDAYSAGKRGEEFEIVEEKEANNVAV